MPITASAKKAARQSIKRRAQNIQKKDAFKNAIKDFKKSIAAKDISKAAETLKLIYQTLDKAAKVNAIHKNRASRLKSRLASKLAGVKA